MADELKITGTATIPGWRTYDVDLNVQLSLRDLFAAFAMAGIAAANMDQDYSSDAAMAYGYADAMLVQRQKEDDN